MGNCLATLHDSPCGHWHPPGDTNTLPPRAWHSAWETGTIPGDAGTAPGYTGMLQGMVTHPWGPSTAPGALPWGSWHGSQGQCHISGTLPPPWGFGHVSRNPLTLLGTMTHLLGMLPPQALHCTVLRLTTTHPTHAVGLSHDPQLGVKATKARSSSVHCPLCPPTPLTHRQPGSAAPSPHHRVPVPLHCLLLMSANEASL